MAVSRFTLQDATFQIIAACIVHSLAIQAGVNMAYSTILLPQIMMTNSTELNVTEELVEFTEELVVNKHEATWVASLVTITTPVGSLITGPLMDRFGRKTVCIVTSIPFIISWTIVALTTKHVYFLYLARILAGIGGGLSTVGLVYVSEVSHPSVRPMLLSINSVFVSFGILLTTILGYFLTWKQVGICIGLLSVICLILSFFIPESPTWLAVKSSGENRRLHADNRVEKAVRWFYRDENQFEEQYNTVLKINEKKTDKLLDTAEVPTEQKQKPFHKQIILLVTLFVLQQFSGCYVVIFYAVQIFQQIGGQFSSGLDEFSAVVILGIIRFVMSILTVFLSKNFGRKTLFILSGVGMTVSSILCAIWLYFFSLGVVPVLLILSYVLFSAVGYLVIPWTLIGEILPQRIRGVGSGLMVGAAYVLMFITVKMFIYTIDYFGIVAVFLFFSIVTLAGIVFVYFKVPETLGRTFKEIEEYFD